MPDGDATLIHSQWLLTAAHVAQDLRIRSASCGRMEYRIVQRVVHPSWRDGHAHDLALVRLHRSVVGVTPLPLYDAYDEAGKTVVFVGHGDTGTGLSGPVKADRKVRAATNVIDAVDGDWLYFDFDEPPAGTELEGVSGPGDSGGPALLSRDGVYHLAGISVTARAESTGLRATEPGRATLVCPHIWDGSAPRWCAPRNTLDLDGRTDTVASVTKLRWRTADHAV